MMELTVNGKTAFAATGGKDFDKSLPVILFVHGASFDRTVWRLQSRYFAWHGYAVLALDLPGHGRSEGPPIDSIEGMGSWLLAAMDAAGVEKAALIAHSMGTLAALEAAAQAPARMKGLCLLGCSYPMGVGDPLLKPAAGNEHIAMERLTSWGYGRAAEMGGNPTPGIWMTGAGLRVLERSAEGLLYNDLNACNDYKGGEAAAAAITCPVDFILGEKDIMTPVRNARPFAEKFADARVRIIPGAGHIMFEEYPDAALDMMIDFAKRAG